MRPVTSNVGSNVPAFLSKLWKMVNDPETNYLISWSQDGHSFIIENQAEFWYNLLPIYYKHNNMSSFIRQLNMYGFHKVANDNGGMECEKDEIKFFHPYFVQNQPKLIQHIKRKIANTKATTVSTEESKVPVDQITKVLVDVKQLRGRQESVDSQLATMKQENAALWRELALLRQKHLKQQQIVNKLIHFLVTIVQPSRSGLGGLGVKRRYPLMINDSRESKTQKRDQPSDGPTIHELDPEALHSESSQHMSELPNDLNTGSEIQGQVDSPLSNTQTEENSEIMLDIPIIVDADGSISSILLGGTNLITNGSNSEESTVADLLQGSSIAGIDASLTNTESEDYPIIESDLQDVMIDKEILQAANEYIDINNLKSDTSTQYDDSKSISPSRVLINPNMKDTLISNMSKEDMDVNRESTFSDKRKTDDESTAEANRNMAIATRSSLQDTLKLNNADVFCSNEFGNHLETTQSDLESIKDILFEGGYTLDANALLGKEVNFHFDAIPFQLFSSDESFPMDVPQLSMPNDDASGRIESNSDELFSGSELIAYNPNEMLDFENLFENTTDGDLIEESPSVNSDTWEQINTPTVVRREPGFPKIKNFKSK